MRNSGSAKSASASAQAFGQLLRRYREREELSQRQLASILAVDGSTIAKIEAGTRKPPHTHTFYERLREVPGFSIDDVKNLLRTYDAPAWLDDEKAIPTAVASVAGLHVEVRLHADTSGLSDEEVQSVKQVIQADVEACLQDYFRLKEERSQRFQLEDERVHPH